MSVVSSSIVSVEVPSICRSACRQVIAAVRMAAAVLSRCRLSVTGTLTTDPYLPAFHIKLGAIMSVTTLIANLENIFSELNVEDAFSSSRISREIKLLQYRHIVMETDTV